MNDYPDFATAYPLHRGEQSAPIRALLLDDSDVDRRRLKRFCRQADLSIDFTEAISIAEFAAKIDAASYDVVLLDYRLIHGDGLIALEMLRRHPNQKTANTIMVAGEGQIQVAIDAMKNGCVDFLLKDSLGPDVLHRSIMRALRSDSDEGNGTDQSDPSELTRFARRSLAEMRSTLSSLLRRTRSLRRAANDQVYVTSVDIEKIDESCARLWEQLEEYQGAISQFGEPSPRRVH